MKQTIAILSLFVACFTTLAQKPDIKSQKIALKSELPSFLKNLKTFSYEIQDDGEYWNYTPSPKYYPKETYPNLASLTDGVNIEGLTPVKENPDLKILVGFIGNQLAVNNALISMNGTYSMMLLTNKNELIYNFTTDITLNETANPEKFPMDTRDERNQTKARILTIYTQKYLDELQYLFKETSMQKLPFALFKKTKGGNAEKFNTQTKPLIEAIVNDPGNNSVVDKAITFWNSQKEVDFGKKVKDKTKDKVLYVNLTTAAILKNDEENAKTYYKTAKQNAGFFNLWTIDYVRLFEKLATLKQLNTQKLVTIPPSPNTIYYYTINGGGTYTYKGKERVFSKITIERFVPQTDSGVASLDTTKKPKIFIYGDDNKSLRHFASEHNKIVTNDGREIIFKKEEGAFKPFIKQTDGTYKAYENY